jgi:3-oxoadipate enol-lactonase
MGVRGDNVRMPATTLALLLACGVQAAAASGVQKTSSGLAYERAGSGPAVVLLHGAFLDRRMWNREFDALKEKWTVIRYDLRMHGESALPAQPFSHVADLIGLLDEFGIGKATLIGLSNGAQIALDTALEAPSRIERIVLAGPAIGGYVERERPAFAADLMAALQAGDTRRATEVMLATPVYGEPAESRDLVRLMLTANERIWKLDRKLVQQPAVPALKRLEELNLPALVVVGDRDMPSILEQADILGARVPRARVVRIKGGGHLVNLTSPGEFLRITTDFLLSR